MSLLSPEASIFLRCGGRPVVPTHLVGSVQGVADLAPKDVLWNFGVKPPTTTSYNLVRAKPSFHQRYPKLKGKWDGKSTINHWDAIRAVMGDKAEDLIQYQVRGTCGGRAGSFCMDAVQCVLLASKAKSFKFHRVSHAAVYYFARKLAGMLSGNWRDENNDGVASGSVPEAMSRMGLVEREEDNDTNYYGQGSDDLACQLGSGGDSSLASKLIQLGKDRLITDWSPVHSAQELADGIASGGVGVGSDNQGFTMTRDKDGFCRPQGSWSHYQVRISVGDLAGSGRMGFGYNQSWGRDTPDGPKLKGHPGNCFGVDFGVQDQIIRSGDWAVVFGFNVWDLEEGNLDIPWRF